jgi:hypothetical protein
LFSEAGHPVRFRAYRRRICKWIGTVRKNRLLLVAGWAYLCNAGIAVMAEAFDFPAEIA